ncbi:MAG: hypothetical protein EOP50_09385, partial [Sphingobacteriales bacterium]
LQHSVTGLQQDVRQLLHWLHSQHYQFISISPASHAAYLKRVQKTQATDLRDIFGWSLPFEASLLPADLFEKLLNQQLITPDQGLWRSSIRVSSLQDSLLIHSSYPTSADHAVFFGPDTYRFVHALKHFLASRYLQEDHLEQNHVERHHLEEDHLELNHLNKDHLQKNYLTSHQPKLQRVLELCSGAAPAAITLAQYAPDAEVFATDVNPQALSYAQINASYNAAGHIQVQHSNLFEQLDGTFDLICANPPYLVDQSQRLYRHGGGLMGAELALNIVRHSLAHLSEQGSLLLYTGVVIVGGQDLFYQAVMQLKDGHLETRLPALGSHELDELAAGINRMAETLQNAQEELQHSVDQATEDVRQNLETIEIQNIELDLARKEALEASRIKSEFLANMSHEIRTPLNGILGFTHLLQKSELTPRQLDYLGTIEKSADSLLGIINEILDFSKIEAGKLVLDSIPFNLRDLLQDTLTILAPAAHAKQLELVSLVYRDTPLALIGDPLRLKQILTNLVSNAIKFTREGTIVARAEMVEDHEDSVQLRISVQDTGIGLSNQDVRALFQAFSQADNSLSRQPGGTGLGLVISKRLIEQMGGEIGVDS